MTALSSARSFTMTDRFYVGSRKGLFTVERGGNGWAITNVAFVGENVSMFLPDARDGVLYAVLNHGHFGNKVHRSNDSSRSWQECGVPSFPSGAVVPDGFPEEGQDRATKPASLSEIWALETGGLDQPETLWAGTIPGAVFRSDDGGQSWNLNCALWDRPERMKWFGGGKDDPGVHSICVDPRNSDHVSIAISCGGVWDTHDGGESWTLIGDGLRQEYVPPDLAFDKTTQDAHRLAQSAANPDVMWVQHHNGIFHSTNAGLNFREITDVQPSAFGFAVCAHPHDPLTAWFVPAVKDECRVPVDGRLVVTRTRDGGVSFEQLCEGLPQTHCYDLVFRHAMDVDATGDQLVIGSSTGGLWVSEDQGETWQTLTNTLPPIYCVRFER